MTVIGEPRSASLLQMRRDRAMPGTGSVLPTTSDADRLRPLVDGLLGLRANWDSYGGRPTIMTAAETALTLMVELNWMGPPADGQSYERRWRDVGVGSRR